MSLPPWWVDDETPEGIVISDTTLAIVDIDIQIARTRYLHSLLTCMTCGEHSIHAHWKEVTP